MLTGIHELFGRKGHHQPFINLVVYGYFIVVLVLGHPWAFRDIFVWTLLERLVLKFYGKLWGEQLLCSIQFSLWLHDWLLFWTWCLVFEGEHFWWRLVRNCHVLVGTIGGILFIELHVLACKFPVLIEVLLVTLEQFPLFLLGFSPDCTQRLPTNKQTIYLFSLSKCSWWK